MAVSRKSTHTRRPLPAPPLIQGCPVIHGNQESLTRWLLFYWRKLDIPTAELALLAITQDRQEFMRWTGKRLDTMALGCYCYIPAHGSSTRAIRARLTAEEQAAYTNSQHRHLIFIEPALQAQSLEVTVAHELIHLSDRVQGNPRRHRHHGYDAIAADEAAITGYALEDLRLLLREESGRLECQRRARRPIRYLYACSNCGKQYPRTRRYSQAVSCSQCDKTYNPLFILRLVPLEQSKDAVD